MQVGPVSEKVALGYLELGIAGAILLTFIIILVVASRWAGKQRELDRDEQGKQRGLDRTQFSEQLNAEREDVKDERKTHLEVTEKMADAITDQTGTFQAMVSDQRKDFTGAMQALTKDQIELAKLKARADSRSRSDD